MTDGRRKPWRRIEHGQHGSRRRKNQRAVPRSGGNGASNGRFPGDAAGTGRYSHYARWFSGVTSADRLTLKDAAGGRSSRGHIPKIRIHRDFRRNSVGMHPPSSKPFHRRTIGNRVRTDRPRARSSSRSCRQPAPSARRRSARPCRHAPRIPSIPRLPAPDAALRRDPCSSRDAAA